MLSHVFLRGPRIKRLVFYTMVALLLGLHPASSSLLSTFHVLQPAEGSPQAVMYHLVVEEPFTGNAELFYRPADFEAQLQALNDAGYTFLFADQREKAAGPSVILTFDDGYADNYTTVFPLLKKYNAKATIFMVSGQVDKEGYLTADQLREMADSGYVLIGSHTVTHRALPDLPAEEVQRELADSQQALAELLGREVTAFAYPYGAWDPAVALKAARYYDYCYTTTSPPCTPAYTNWNIPRYHMVRSEGPSISLLTGE